MLPVLYLSAVALVVSVGTVALHRESRFPRTLLMASIGTLLGAVAGVVPGALAEVVNISGGAVTAAGAAVAPLGAILIVVLDAFDWRELRPLGAVSDRPRQRSR